MVTYEEGYFSTLVIQIRGPNTIGTVAAGFGKNLSVLKGQNLGNIKILSQIDYISDHYHYCMNQNAYYMWETTKQGNISSSIWKSYKFYNNFDILNQKGSPTGVVVTKVIAISQKFMNKIKQT